MQQPMFEYMEYVIVTDDEGWILSDKAPDYVKEAFEQYMKEGDMFPPLKEE